MKKHRWQKSRFARIGRKCINCGVRRRIKPGTRCVWEYRMFSDEQWFERYDCIPVRKESPKE